MIDPSAVLFKKGRIVNETEYIEVEIYLSGISSGPYVRQEKIYNKVTGEHTKTRIMAADHVLIGFDENFDFYLLCDKLKEYKCSVYQMPHSSLCRLYFGTFSAVNYWEFIDAVNAVLSNYKNSRANFNRAEPNYFKIGC